MNIQTRQYADEIFRPKDDTDESQLWLIAGLDAGLETVMIYNKVNGALLAANKSRTVTRAVRAAPYEKRARWIMDRNTFNDTTGKPVVLTNVGIPGVLDLSGTKQAPGTPILVYPKHNPVAKNQGWYLQYME
ncbi:MAG: hypothetical protein L6R35_000665 [Caloplaca aegaea]|nr:MAG: hypothetical protein L6R35_000665 [Caloplaca aegaea]